MTNIYMARHGSTDLNKAGIYFGWTDDPLNDEGKVQCGNIRQKLEVIKFDAVITSPLKRTVESSKIITGLDKGSLDIYGELKELNFGKWEKLHYKEIQEYYSEDWQHWVEDWKNFPIPEGESFDSFYQRVKLCFEGLLKKYKDKTILIVGHQGVLRIMATLLLKLDPEYYWRFTFEFGTWSLFQVDDDFALIKKIN